MGFEIDNESIDIKKERDVAASAKKIGTVTFIKNTNLKIKEFKNQKINKL